MNYTEGEWKVSELQAKIVVASDGQHTREVADCRNPNLLPSEEIANAHLIASAPDMYEALKEAILLLATELHIHPDNPILKTVVDTGHKALAKAEGK